MNMGNDMRKDTNDNTAFGSNKNDKAKDNYEKDNNPDRNVGWGIPSSVPYQLNHDNDEHNNDRINTDETHKTPFEPPDSTNIPVGEANEAPVTHNGQLAP